MLKPKCSSCCHLRYLLSSPVLFRRPLFQYRSYNNMSCGSGFRIFQMAWSAGGVRKALLLQSSNDSRGRFSSHLVARRGLHNRRSQHDPLRTRSTLYYLAAVGVLVVGASYAAVPLYRIFCQSYSYGGTTGTHDNTRDLSQMKKVKEKQITIKFNADRSSSLMWNFRPEQAEIIVTPGETALAFYRAENRTSLPVDGISTYNVIPYEAGQYFNKIQCFCFEEQRLNPGETVELPVFFYIDPEFADDPKMESVDMITLSYTFFESKDMPSWVLQGAQLPARGHGSSTTNSSSSSSRIVATQ